MTTLLALAPLLLVLGLLASGRAGALVAGLAGLTATLAAAFVVVLQGRGSAVLGPLLVHETAAGAWLAYYTGVAPRPTGPHALYLESVILR